MFRHFLDIFPVLIYGWKESINKQLKQTYKQSWLFHYTFGAKTKNAERTTCFVLHGHIQHQKRHNVSLLLHIFWSHRSPFCFGIKWSTVNVNKKLRSLGTMPRKASQGSIYNTMFSIVRKQWGHGERKKEPSRITVFKKLTFWQLKWTRQNNKSLKLGDFINFVKIAKVFKLQHLIKVATL